MAAAHAIGSAAGAIAPRVDVMRERMIEPTVDKSVDMARNGARRAGTVARRVTGRKVKVRTGRNWSRTVGGLMVVGVVLGAVSALLSRRRQRKWDEYDSTGDYGSTGNLATEQTRSMTESARSAASSAAETVKNAAETAKDKASDVMGQMKGASDTSPSTGTSESFSGGSGGSGGAGGSGSRNGRP
ncbi:hypothetical protein ACNTMW_11115 [Planosporangium sp. 12N6]